MSAARLRRKIVDRISAHGPLSLAAYMAMALHDPADGYYAGRSPIGATGDFVTAPEISQIFGELIGLWCASVWRQAGSPEPVIVAELGPGRGTLMADFLRAAAIMPDFVQALRLHLVEASPVLRRAQKERLASAQPVWVETIEELPAGPLLLVANEFLDALPIRQFERGERHWSERMVGLDGEGNLVFLAGSETPAADAIAAASGRAEGPLGAVAEICPSALALAGWLGRRLAGAAGAALLIDYGYVSAPLTPTLRGVQGHRPVPPLTSPGAVDLSAEVDFAAFAAAGRAAGASVYGPVAQGRFLRNLGAETRLERLRRHASPAQGEALAAAVARLLDPEEMGNLFKVVALVSSGLPRPPGFD
jgi:NADH dehydrogenase [ubiquinone] 1 alpha subcomplex assembly factor 7